MRQAKKRVEALKRMRGEMQRRFMLLYRHFRLKKYGEPLTNDTEVDDLFEEDKEMIRRIKQLREKDTLAAIKTLKKDQD